MTTVNDSANTEFMQTNKDQQEPLNEHIFPSGNEDFNHEEATELSTIIEERKTLSAFVDFVIKLHNKTKLNN